MSGSLVLNDMSLVLNAVLDGIGIGYIAEHVISPRVADGQLVPLLGDWCGHISGAYLYYPSRRHVPGPLRAFIDFIRTQSDLLDAVRLKKSVNEPIVSGPVGSTRWSSPPDPTAAAPNQLPRRQEHLGSLAASSCGERIGARGTAQSSIAILRIWQ